MIDHTNLIVTRIKSKLNKDGKVFVSSTILQEPPYFPAVSVRTLGNPSTGSSFANHRLAARATVEIQAYSEVSVDEARKIIEKCDELMNEMYFDIIYGPEDVSTSSDLKRVIVRYRRVFGAGDSV